MAKARLFNQSLLRDFGVATPRIADEGSFRAAVWAAMDIRQRREHFRTITANPLQPQERGKKEKV
ncbi:MAG: hypothetical protein JNM31_02585 [Flavobacteriales bacterium]|nr:hypothetical protein [Flavobacteriales bacterium]